MKEKVKCELCVKELSRQCLAAHQKKPVCEKGRSKYQESLAILPETTEIPPEPIPSTSVTSTATYCFSMDVRTTTDCAVMGCPFKHMMRTNMQLHFRNKHNQDTIKPQEEGLLLRCEKCRIFLNEKNMARHKIHKFAREERKFSRSKKFIRRTKRLQQVRCSR